MRGENGIQSGMFSSFSPEQRVPAEHPFMGCTPGEKLVSKQK